ncbi:TPR end-of-group domain-containing protein [Granulicella rosea]|uniref:TPR end-of-group domain-containing protein n=1 Tax=Granulicella rosea TaxID=474952 RepID=UPI001FEA66A5|nr:hypothetical protein [Granulicella rosea]
MNHALEGEYDSLRERMIGAEMFGRRVDYDTGSDSVVRVKATEVRKKLAQYYLESGAHEVRLELPSGSYVPRFVFQPVESVDAAAVVPVSSLATPTAPSTASGQISEAAVDRPEEDAIHAAAPWKRLARVSPYVWAGLVLLAVAAIFGMRRWVFGNGATAIRSVAVLPLENHSGVPAQEYIADGMTKELVSDLGQVGALKVATIGSVMSYQGTRKSATEIGKELGVEGIVQGSILREGTRVLVYVRFIDARANRVLWMHNYVRDLKSALAWQGEVSQAIVKEIAASATPQGQARSAHSHPVDPVAQDLYLHGRYLLEAEDCVNAADYFRAALNVNSSYPQAQAGLAFCDGHLGETDRINSNDAFANQKIEALKAIELDPTVAEGHAELANAAINLNWDWATAGAEFRRALELNPKSASIHEEYERYLVRTGRVRETLAEVQRSEDMDPTSSRLYHLEGVILYYCRQYDQALLLVQKVRTMDIPPPNWHFLMGEIDAEKGAYADAIFEFLHAGSRPQTLGHLGNLYARAGQVDNALAIIPQLEETVKNEGIGRYEIALVYAGLGRKTEAFKWLEESYKAHDEGITYIKVEPCLDPLRGDPRFNDLLSRVGLTQ